MFSLFSVNIRWYPNALNRGWPEAVRVLARGRARGILPGPKPKLTPPESERIWNKGRGGKPRCHRASLASLRLNNRISVPLLALALRSYEDLAHVPRVYRNRTGILKLCHRGKGRRPLGRGMNGDHCFARSITEERGCSRARLRPIRR